jgi:hypothetical protein
MPQENRDTPTADDLQVTDGLRDSQRETPHGSMTIGIFPMGEGRGIEDGDNISVTQVQPFHQVHDQSTDDICTASPSEAAPQITDTTSQKFSLESEVEISKDTSKAPSFGDEILESNDTTTTATEGTDQQAQKADETKAKQPQRSDDINALAFIKDKKGLYRPVADQRLRNNLLPSVGFLEFANATDFAANVWNTIPVPKFAAALMGLGGAVALSLVPFAIKDGLLCWQNSKMLIQERILLLREAGEVVDEEKGKMRVALQKGLDTRLEVNRKELGTELFDRGSMDLLMGISALLVGIGTLMAIGGANPRVYHASNLLSGYIGNSPSTAWGLCNTAWCIYLFKRARHHLAVGEREVGSEEVRELLKRRIGSVQRHAVIMGLSTLVSAAGGLITVTHWYGYPMLIPCIIASIFGNWYWRKRLGYDRPLVRTGHEKMSKESLINEIEWVASMQASLATARHSTISNDLVSEPKSVTAIIELIVRCDLFEELSERLLLDLTFASMMKTSPDGSVIISPAEVSAVGEQIAPMVFASAEAVMQEKGLRQLSQKQRYLLEMLGATVVENQGKASQEMSEKEEESNG